MVSEPVSHTEPPEFCEKCGAPAAYVTTRVVQPSWVWVLCRGCFAEQLRAQPMLILKALG